MATERMGRRGISPGDGGLHRCPSTSVTAPLPASPSLPQHQHHCQSPGPSPGKETRLPLRAREGPPERGKLTSHLAGERASLAGARTPRSRSWRCTGCPARSTPSTAFSGAACTSASKTPCPHVSPDLLARKIHNWPMPTEARGYHTNYRITGANLFSAACRVPAQLAHPKCAFTQPSCTLQFFTDKTT